MSVELKCRGGFFALTIQAEVRCNGCGYRWVLDPIGMSAGHILPPCSCDGVIPPCIASRGEAEDESGVCFEFGLDRSFKRGGSR